MQQQLKRLENGAHRDDSRLTMKSQLIAIVAAVLVVGCGESQQSASPEGTKTVEVATPQPEPDIEHKKLWAKSYLNQKAPELIVEKWLSEKPEWKGKFLLVDFWATWCGPCLKAIPELNRFHEQFGKQMVVVGLSDEQASKVASMKQPHIE